MVIIVTKYLSFPGLGIGEFGISDTAFSLFGLDIKWYGVIITVGMILAFFIARNRAKYEGILEDDIYDITLFCIIFGVIGARLYYVLFQLDDYIVTGGTLWENIKDSFLAIINIRGGGLAIYGGIIGGFVTALIVTRIKKIRFPVLMDVAAPALLVGQAIGRWGNFMNVEAYGRVTVLPWRMCSPTIADELIGKGLIDAEGYAQILEGSLGVHPTFLYESLWNLAALALILVFYKKKKFNGQVFFFYMGWYGLGRAVIEGLRTDSLMLGSIRISQLVAILAFVAGAIMFVFFMKKTPKIMQILPAESVEPTTAEVAEESPEISEENTDNESETDNGKAD